MQARHDERGTLVQLGRAARQLVEAKPDLVLADARERQVRRDAVDEADRGERAGDLCDPRRAREAAAAERS